MVMECCGGAIAVSLYVFFLQYKKKTKGRGRAKAAGWVDMDLPPSSKCSWWRLDDYSTYDEAPTDSGDSGGDDDSETTNGDHDDDHDAAVMDMELSDFSD